MGWKGWGGRGEGKPKGVIVMIGIEWVFIGGAVGIVGVAVLEKAAEDFGFGWVGRALRVLLPIASLGTSFILLDVIWKAFLR